MLLALTAMAAPIQSGLVTLADAGNGQGWNDGHAYTGYVTLNLNGTDYTALCVDALHETAVNSTWNALYVPLSDTDTLRAVMAAYYPNTAASTYTAGLYVDVVGFLMMLGADKNLAIALQHEVWGQLDPADYDGSSLRSLAASSNGSFIDSHGNQVAFSTANFGLLVDANYLRGGQLQQAFLIDPPTSTPEPASLLLIGAGLVVLGVVRRKNLR